VKTKATTAPGVSPFRLIGAAAVLGVVAGTALSFLHTRELDATRAREVPAAITGAMPIGAPAPAPSPDMMAPDPRSLEGIPVYPNAAPRRMFSGDTRTNGVGSISWFETQDTVDDILKFFDDGFIKAHHSTVKGRPSPQRGFVGWFDRQHDSQGHVVFGEGTMHMVTVSDEGSRRMVFLSANEPMRILERRDALPGGVRFPLGAQPHVLRVGEVEQEHASIFADYEKQDRDQVAEAFEKMARDDGWEISARVTNPEGVISMNLTRGQFVQMASIERLPGGGAHLFTAVEAAHLEH
jgi:hypothetical protein